MRGEAVAAVEDLVADRAAGRQTLLRQSQAGIRDLVGRHQDLAAVAGDAVGDVAASELLDHLGGVAQVEIAVEQRHRLGAAAQHHQREHSEHAERDCSHRGEPSRAQGSQPVHEGLHCHPPLRLQRGACSVAWLVSRQPGRLPWSGDCAAALTLPLTAGQIVPGWHRKWHAATCS